MRGKLRTLSVSFVLLAPLCFSIRNAAWEAKPLFSYKVLSPITAADLAVFPVVSESVFDTSRFLTLDEGIRSGKVVITEVGQTSGLIRPRPNMSDGVWREYPEFPRMPSPQPGPQVNTLALTNHSDRPLLLLAGEIVTGGKQDRVIGKDRIVPAHSEPISLDVFCVEPHRWTIMPTEFGSLGLSFAQPSVRREAMAERNQQQVWAAVSKSRAAFASALPSSQARSFETSSSYAAAVEGGATRLDSIVAPIERSYEKLLPELRAENAVGVVVAAHGEIIWADVFASPSLLEKYWPKLIRSYAAECFTPGVSPATITPSKLSAQEFLNRLNSNHEQAETEPGVYRNTEFEGGDFDAFILTSLLPNTGFDVHIAKMKR